MPSGAFPGQTVQAFLSGNPSDNEHQSLLALRAKSSILYEKSAQIAARWSPRKRAFATASLLRKSDTDDFGKHVSYRYDRFPGAVRCTG